jgi:hypothetical protein
MRAQLLPFTGLLSATARRARRGAALAAWFCCPPRHEHARAFERTRVYLAGVATAGDEMSDAESAQADLQPLLRLLGALLPEQHAGPRAADLLLAAWHLLRAQRLSTSARSSPDTAKRNFQPDDAHEVSELSFPSERQAALHVNSRYGHFARQRAAELLPAARHLLRARHRAHGASAQSSQLSRHRGGLLSSDRPLRTRGPRPRRPAMHAHTQAA